MKLSGLLIAATLTGAGYAKKWHFCTCRIGKGQIASSDTVKTACERNVIVGGNYWTTDNHDFESYNGRWCVADQAGGKTIDGSNMYDYCRGAGATDSCCVNTDTTNKFVTDSSDGC